MGPMSHLGSDRTGTQSLVWIHLGPSCPHSSQHEVGLLSLSSFSSQLYRGHKKKSLVVKVLKTSLKKEGGDKNQTEYGDRLWVYSPPASCLSPRAPWELVLPRCWHFCRGPALSCITHPSTGLPSCALLSNSGTWPPDQLITCSSLKTVPCSQWNSPGNHLPLT